MSPVVLLATKQSVFYIYGAYDVETCTDFATCAPTPYAGWLTRQYVAGTLTNVAPLASASASSQNTSTGQPASAAVDVVISGYRETPRSGDGRRGRRQSGETRRPVSYTISDLVLFDRPNADDQVTSGTLTFSNGTVVSFRRAAQRRQRPHRAHRHPRGAHRDEPPSVLMTVTGVSSTTLNIGLSEIQAFGTATDRRVAPPSRSPDPPRPWPRARR